MNIQKQGKLQITKVDKENRMVFGFFNVNKIADKVEYDLQDDRIETEEIENAAYDFVLNARVAGDSHVRKGVGLLVESMVFTAEKQTSILKTLEKAGIKDAQFNLGIEGWWGGFLVTDDEVLKKIIDGVYTMFSVGGRAEQRIEEE